ncbi:hypothetical protein GEMRC1_002750 [Eukaryota sp. GEM-RC1]
MTTFISMFLDPRFAWMNMVAAMRTESYFPTFKAMYHLKKEEHLNAGSNVQNISIDDDGAVDNDVIVVEDEGNVDALFDDDDSDEEVFLESLQSHEVMEEVDELERCKSLYPIENKSCPLMWWKLHNKEYPTLAGMARDFLIIPATSIPCERVFSVAHIKSKKRSSLADESRTSLMLLKDWLNYGYELVDCSDDENDEYADSLDS